MNKITARALNDRAVRHGHRIIVVSGTWGHADHARRELEAEAAADAVHRITRSNGKQRIDYLNGGRISVVSAQGHGYRGQSADLVFIDWDAETLHPGIAHEFVPCVQGSPTGEVIRA